jgi:anti-sigma factor RsiW
MTYSNSRSGRAAPHRAARPRSAPVRRAVRSQAPAGRDLSVLARAGAHDIQSGNVHQVKPVLTNRLDFAPRIPFEGDAEFPLLGGGVDYFLDRRAAIVVYGRRLHTVTLIVTRPDDLQWPGRPHAASARGFNVRFWQADGLGYPLVSDIDAAELARLAGRLGG